MKYPSSLQGNRLRLEQLTESHLQLLFELLCETSSFIREKWGLHRREEFDRWACERLWPDENKTRQAYVISIKYSGRIAGLSQFKNLSAQNRSVEIGNTWLAPAWCRTFVNTEAKLLMLTNAFETMMVSRAEFTVDIQNFSSIRALERIGAQRERDLVDHRRASDGSLRTLRVYRVINTEWPLVRKRLQDFLLRAGASMGAPRQR